MNDKKPMFLLYRESAIQSIMSDSISFLFLVGSTWFNYRFIGGSYFLNGVILFMFMFFMFARATAVKKKAFNSVDELQRFVDELKEGSNK